MKNTTSHKSIESLLRMERIPHIWCSGCGIGVVLNCFIRALLDIEYDLNKVVIVSGIGCTGRIAGYVKLDSFHTTHGRAIPFATGLKLANPELKVVVISGDGDLSAIGGNHFIHAGRRNTDITVICVNNFLYSMTGGQVGPTTPMRAIASTAPYGNYEQAFNLPFLAESIGAVYVARWTAYHVVQLTKAMRQALMKQGFSFIEVISQCPTLYLRRNRIKSPLVEMQYFKEKSKVNHGARTNELALDFQGDIVVGKFVDKERKTYLQSMNEYYKEVFGDSYQDYNG